MVDKLRYKLDLQMFAEPIRLITFIFDEGVKYIDVDDGGRIVSSSGEKVVARFVVMAAKIIIVLKDSYSVSSITSLEPTCSIDIIDDTSFTYRDDSDTVGGIDNTITITTTKTGGGVV